MQLEPFFTLTLFQSAVSQHNLKVAVRSIRFCPVLYVFSTVLYVFCSHAIMYEDFHSSYIYMALYSICCFSKFRFCTQSMYQ